MEALLYKPLYYRIAVGILFFNQGIIFSAWATRIPDFKNALNLTESQLGSLLFALPLGQILVMMLSGWLVAKFTSKNVIKISAFIHPAMLLLLASAGSYLQLFWSLLLFGMCANLTNISINTQSIDVERIYGRSINASFHGIWSLAGFVGGLLSMLLVAYNVSVWEHFIGVVAYIWCILFFILKYTVPTDFSPAKNDESGKTRSMFKPTPYILLLGLFTFACMSCEGSMFDWSVIYFRDVIGTPKDISRVGFASFMSAMAMGRFLADFFIEKFGRMALLRLSGTLICVGMLSAIVVPNVYAGAIGFVLVGFGVSSVVPTCYSLAGRSRRLPSGIAIAIVSTIGFFGFLLFPPIIGYIAEISSLRFSFALMGCVGIMVALMSPLLRNRIAEIEKK